VPISPFNRTPLVSVFLLLLVLVWFFTIVSAAHSTVLPCLGAPPTFGTGVATAQVNEQRMGKLRLFPRGLFFNLGFLPRTWQV